jgi:flagellar hook-length control protein FliK
MQVSLLPNCAALLAHNRTDGILPSLPGSQPESSINTRKNELRERIRRDDEQEARALAALVPSRPADVINEAERNVERSSRAFHRQVARDGAAAHFQQDRRAFRQAMAGAREKGPHLTPRNTDNAATQSTTARTSAKRGSPVVTMRPAGPRTEATSAKGPAASNAARPLSIPVPDPSAGSARAAASTGRGVAPDAAATQAPRAPGLRLTAAHAVRLAVSAQSTAARPGGTAGSKAGGPAPAGAGSARSPTKAGASPAVKANAARAAQNTTADANIERIVRVVRSHMSARHSHTVLRLDPPELGSLRLQMDLRGVALTLRIDTTTELAHRLLSDDVDKLRHGLESSGIQLERVEVRPPAQPPQPGEHGGSQHADSHGQEQGESAHADAEHPEERGTESHPAESTQITSRGTDPEPAVEPLVNLVV